MVRQDWKPGDRIHVIPHFLEGQVINPEPLPEDGYFLYLGRLSEEKGLRFLLQAWRQIEDPSARLVIAGTGPEEHFLQRPEPARSRFPRFCFYGSARTIVAWSKSVDRSINLGRTFWLGSIGGLVSWPPGFSFKQGSASGDRGGLVGCVFGGRSRWAGGEDPMVGWGFGGRSTPGERRKEPATGLLQSGTMVV
jgi:hypothetical protein